MSYLFEESPVMSDGKNKPPPPPPQGSDPGVIIKEGGKK